MRSGDEAGVRQGENPADMDQAWRILSYLIAGILFYGFLGWLGDHFLGTSFLLPVGIVLGAGLAIYTSIKRLAWAEGQATKSEGAATRASAGSATKGEQ